MLYSWNVNLYNWTRGWLNLGHRNALYSMETHNGIDLNGGLAGGCDDHLIKWHNHSLSTRHTLPFSPYSPPHVAPPDLIVIHSSNRQYCVY